MEIEPINEYESAAIMRRLTVIRTHVSGENQAAFARLLGILPSRWNNLERGMPLTLRVSFLLVKTVPGLTISYITHGLTGDLPNGLHRQLVDLEGKLFPPSPAKGKRSSKR